MKLKNSHWFTIGQIVWVGSLLAGVTIGAHAEIIVGRPRNLGAPINSSGSDGTPCITIDGLSLYFTSNRAGGRGAHDLWFSTRLSTTHDWDTPINLGAMVNSTASDYFPSLAPDGLSLYFYSTRPGGQGGGDIWMTNRPDLDSAWARAWNCGAGINSAWEDVSPHVSADGLSLWFSSNRVGGYGDYDLYTCFRDSVDAPWSAPVNLGPVINTPHLDVAPTLTADGLVLVFHSTRPGGYGTYDVYTARRPSRYAEWSPPVNLGSPVNSEFSELGPSISGDGGFLYFSDHYLQPPRPGGLGVDDIWEVTFTPMVDFNRNDKVDMNDLLRLIESWGQEDPSVDIAPLPMGDGMVDANDLEMLMRYWQQDVNDPRLLSHWRFDEVEGTLAVDCVSENDARVIGEAKWQPDSGIVGGALRFDGISDYTSTPFVLDPATGVFSVFAWVKGGAPGQVIISQEEGADWLAIDTQGCLMTTLQCDGRNPGGPLISEAIITDDNWHRVGFTWDGTNRILYGDDIEVAHDTLRGLGGSDGGLYIGAGNGFGAGTFWFGLIDDVRIHDRVVVP